jgi:DNA (cytosine-5)-methyltransferase 1
MKILNLFAGIGGNSLHWHGHEVHAVESDERIADNYRLNSPGHTVIIADAFWYVKEYMHEYDFIWASPPCQGNSRLQVQYVQKKPEYPDLRLYELVIMLDTCFGGKWVVENVVPYYKPLLPAQRVCRHMFWANFPITDFRLKRPVSFAESDHNKEREAMIEWLGIQYPKTILYNGNHNMNQVLNNCVHPLLGHHVLKCAMLPGLPKIRPSKAYNSQWSAQRTLDFSSQQSI